MTQNWGFLTNHALVLVYVVRHAGATVREIAAGVGVTERTAYILKVRQLAVGIARAYVDSMAPPAGEGGTDN